MHRLEILAKVVSSMYARVSKLVEASNIQAQLSDALLQRINAQQEVIDALVRKVGVMDETQDEIIKRLV